LREFIWYSPSYTGLVSFLEDRKTTEKHRHRKKVLQGHSRKTTTYKPRKEKKPTLWTF
jgi:hypothetical protein